MAKISRSLHIPNELTDAQEKTGELPALWYAGTLQAENGHDLLVQPVPANVAVPGAPVTPAPVRRPDTHPDDPDAA